MIIDCAVAMDGGSLGLVLKGAAGEENYALIRSILAIGTDRFNRVEGADGLLSESQELVLYSKLIEAQASLPPDVPCVEILTEFINVLRGRNG